MKKSVVFTGTLVAVVACIAAAARWHEQSHLLRTVEQMKAAVTKDFHDPESARFRNIEVMSEDLDLLSRLTHFKAYWRKNSPFMEGVSGVLTYDPRGMVMCGQVNAKNGFGAYVGYRNFVVIGGGADGFVQVDTPDFDLAVKTCAVRTPVIYSAAEQPGTMATPAPADRPH